MTRDATTTVEAMGEYGFGFVTEVEADTLPPGLDEAVIRHISAIKEEPDWLTEWRLSAYRHWLSMREPTWANVTYPPIDYQAISYYSAPKKALGSLDELDPEVLAPAAKPDGCAAKRREAYFAAVADRHAAGVRRHGVPSRTAVNASA